MPDFTALTAVLARKSEIDLSQVLPAPAGIDNLTRVVVGDICGGEVTLATADHIDGVLVEWEGDGDPPDTIYCYHDLSVDQPPLEVTLGSPAIRAWHFRSMELPKFIIYGTPNASGIRWVRHEDPECRTPTGADY